MLLERAGKGRGREGEGQGERKMQPCGCASRERAAESRVRVVIGAAVADAWRPHTTLRDVRSESGPGRLKPLSSLPEGGARRNFLRQSVPTSRRSFLNDNNK